MNIPTSAFADPTIADMPKQTAEPPVITVYGPADCPMCEQATALLTRHSITHTKIDITPGDEHHRFVTEELGYTRAPVIVIDYADHPRMTWGGHRLDLLMATVRLKIIQNR